MDVVYNLFFMFGGVAAMMLGMKIMGSGLEKFAGSNMKKLLGKVTTNRCAGVGVGAFESINQASNILVSTEKKYTANEKYAEIFENYKNKEKELIKTF